MRGSRAGLGPVAAVAALMGLAACGPAQVVIVAELEGDGGAAVVTLSDFEVQLIPYDRDQVFDSLAQAASRPEPQMPADLLAAQEEIARAQQEWRDTETRWNDLRAELQSLNEQLEGLNRGMTEYRTVYRRWQDVEAEYAQLERQNSGLFERFTSLQEAAIGRMDSMRIVRADWEDEAFEDVPLVIAMKLEATGLETVADTTNEGGVANFEVRPGEYWVHARHELPYDELYWNVPIVAVRGEPLQIRLSRSNAEVRPVY